MVLCQNRFEGFGPHSSIHPNVPTQCFVDVIVEPLSTWIYMLLLGVLLPLTFIRRTRGSTSTYYGEEKIRSRGRKIIGRILQVVYYFLIVAMIAMISLEIARLVSAQLGIGLLPFNYVGVLLALGVHVVTRKHSRGAALGRDTRSRVLLRGVSAFYWIMFTASLAIKVAVDQLEIDASFVRTSTQTNYPLSDEVLDNAVMVGIAFVLAVLELATP